MKNAIKIFLVILILMVGGSVGIYQYYLASLEPTEPDEPVVVEIPAGSSTKKIASILEEHHIVRNSQTFSIYVRQMGKGSQLQAGRYQMTPGQTMEQIVNKLIKGEVYVDTIQFTIPEGLTIVQIASLLEEKGWVNKDKFLHEVNHGQFAYEFVKAIPDKESISYRLEGYLFPKTYEMKKGATEHEIIERMLAQFEEEWNPDWDSQLKKRGMSLHQAVTLASIIEREVAVEKESSIVAGVYFNRIAQGILLQADATIQYALGQTKGRLTYKDLELDNPYNTYKHEGLTPGPIAAPGKSSLEAVIHPDQHGYLFYVTKKDGSGEHYFSKTYQEHLRNIALSKTNK